jgi:GNAT superfamily N-acetyltransferase
VPPCRRYHEETALQEEEHTIEIQPLSAQRLPEFLAFFDGSAFSDNPHWASCYCQCFHEDHRQVAWPDRTAAQNRSRACERIAEREMQGFLASAAGKPVGWCSAAPRRLFHALDDEPVADAATVGAVMCFLVAPAHRGCGIARRLLDAACDGLRSQGLAVVEAYPRRHATSPAENHFGPLRLYLSAGFHVHRSDADGSVCVRKAL